MTKVLCGTECPNKLTQKIQPHKRWRRLVNPFLPTVPTFAVRETDVSRHNGGASGAPLKPLRDDSALRALSSLRSLRGAPEVPHYAERRQSLGQQMLERWALNK